MGIRVKSRWNKDKQHSWDEIGGAIAFTIWRVSGQSVLNLENEGFQTDTHQQRLEVMSEFMAFLVHIADRLAHEKNSDEDRQNLIIAMGKRLADTYQDNMTDVAGKGDYRDAFISMLNGRMNDYAEFVFENGEPGYAMRRYLGQLVTETMGPRDKKWISDQVMDIEVPEAMKGLKKALGGLVEPSKIEDDTLEELRKRAPEDY